MGIEQVYVAGCRSDLRLTRCCVASIRRWYPDVPISLVVDESQGAYSTASLERAWGVTRFETDRKRFGWGFGKLEPLFLARRRRCLILDSDTVFLGRVLDALDAVTEDFVVAESTHTAEDLARHYFDLRRLREHDPAFAFPGFTFNSGQFVATTGVLRREDFAELVEFAEPPRLRLPAIFGPGEQGVLNYVLMKKWQQREITLRRHLFMWWSGWLEEGAVRPEQLTDDSPFPFVLHWAGPKYRHFSLMRHAAILRHFEAWVASRGEANGSSPDSGSAKGGPCSTRS
jgi:hypothetical protein